MRRRRTTIEPFGLSFLDLLSCALGAVLLLLLLTVNRRMEETTAADARARDLQSQLDGITQALATGNERWRQANDALERAQRALERARQDQQRTDEEIAQRQEALEVARRHFEEQSRAQLEEMQKVHATLIGLKGDLSHVVFVFDTSGSMKRWLDPSGHPRFPEYKAFLQSWVRELQFDTFNVVRFSDDVARWQPQDMPATSENRRDAAEWIASFEADGFTNTLGAFQAALADPGVTTIVFFSDGEPTVGQRGQKARSLAQTQALMQEVHAWLKQHNAQRKVTINTVGMGDYFKEQYGSFLQKIANDHGGVFIGR